MPAQPKGGGGALPKGWGEPKGGMGRGEEGGGASNSDGVYNFEIF